MTADDVIFNMYVYADPAYDGSAAFNTLPISGLEESRRYVQPVVADSGGYHGKDTSASKYYTAENAADFKSLQTAARFHTGNRRFRVANYLAEYAETATGFTADEVRANPGLQVAMGEYLWGYADGLGDDGLFRNIAGKTYDLKAGQYPTIEEYWELILDTYGYDLSDKGINYESVSTSISDFIGDTLLASYPELTVFVRTGDSAPNITGIEKTGDYSVRVTMDSYDAQALYHFNFDVAPLHYYGDKALYNYEKNMFGFKKGDLNGVKSVTAAPLGAGPYKFVSYKNGVVTFEANELYYKGAPKTKFILFRETSDAGKLTGVAAGTLDISAIRPSRRRCRLHKGLQRRQDGLQCHHDRLR